MKELFIRFFIGGAVVSCFSVLAEMFRPKSFAGLFSAAPSIALATLALTVIQEGPGFAASESRSMIAGSVAFFCYAAATVWLLLRYKPSALAATIGLLPLWFATSFALWAVFLKGTP